MCNLFDICLSIICAVDVYQSLHLLAAFMLLPTGQLKALTKSSLCDKGPIALKDTQYNSKIKDA